MSGEPTLPGDVVCRLFGDAPVELARLGGGANSRVFRVDFPGQGQEPVVLKQYPRISRDPRDRLGTEFAALEFMRARGICRVPRPLAMDREVSCAVYSHVPGRPALEDIQPDDVARTVEFWAALDTLRDTPEALAMPPASEACFSPGALCASLRERRLRLERAVPLPGLASRLESFLKERFDPALEDVCASLERGWTGGVPLGPEELTLSPSDFGFHNALRVDGELFFIDFEYFGKDDPAKLMADFLLHPGMDLAPDACREFLAAMAERLRAPGPALARLKVVYPAYGLKWCLILLNEFLPRSLNSRAFAFTPEEALARQENQLARAEAMLGRADPENRRLNPLECL